MLGHVPASAPRMSPSDATQRAHRRARLRVAVVALAFVAVAGLLSLEGVHAWLERVLASVSPHIQGHPVTGGAVFVLLSALSAVVAFFSSAVLVPAAVYTWGEGLTAALLWLGWWLGGLGTYAIGRALRRPLMHAAGARRQFDLYRAKVPADAGFVLVFLLQLALPSEIPGYLCGVLRVPLRTYAAALALAELPYAVGTVLMGESLVLGRPGVLLALGAVALVGGWYALRILRKRLSSDAP